MEVIKEAYEEIDAYIVAKSAKKRYREVMGIDKSESLGYGEIDLNDFNNFLHQFVFPLIFNPDILADRSTASSPTTATASSSSGACGLQGNEDHIIFSIPELKDNSFLLFDCGSGSGRAVHVACYAAKVVFKSDISRLGFVGVEILEDLHEIALKVNKSLIGKGEGEYKQCKFILDDSFSEDSSIYWYNSSVIFIPCTLFTEELMNKVYEKIQSGNMKEGTVLISTTRKLVLPDLITKGRKSKDLVSIEQILESRRKYAKGSLTFYVYKVHKSIIKDKE